MDRMGKEVMLTSLNEAGIAVSASASISQIRSLFAELCSKTPEIDNECATLADITPDAIPGKINAASDSTESSLTASNIPSANAVNNTAAITDAQIVPTSVNSVNITAVPDAAAMEANNDNIARKLEYLRQQKELLLLQREIDELQGAARPPQAFDLSHIEAMVSPFSADDNYAVGKWFSDLEDAFEVLKLDDRAKFVATRRLLTGTAKIFLRTVATFQYADLKKALIEEFSRAYSNQEVYVQLRNRRLRSNENVKRYIIEMQEIASRANISETELIDCIIGGLTDTNFNTSILYGATDLRQLKNLLERHERIRPRVAVRSVHSVRSPMPSVSAAANSNTTTAAKVPISKNHSTVTESTEVRCFNCSKYGHFQSQCPKPKRPEGSCFRCGQLDHVYRNCPLRLPPAVAAVNTSNADALCGENMDQPDALVNRINSMQMVSVAFSFNDRLDGRYSHVFSLFDSGSPTSFINETVLPYICQNPISSSGYYSIANTPLPTLGKIECLLKFKGILVKHEFIILPKEASSFNMIIGRDLLPKFNVYLCHVTFKYSKNDLLRLNKENYYEELESHVSTALRSLEIYKNNVNVDGDGVKRLIGIPYNEMIKNHNGLRNGSVPFNQNTFAGNKAFEELCAIDISHSAPFADINPCLNAENLNCISEIIQKNYVEGIVNEAAEIDYEMKIQLTTDQPVFSRPRRLSYHERRLVQEVIDDLLKRGIIQPSHSAYASPIVLVRKKNGKIRKCCDYRSLNKITCRDNYPMPVIEDCLEHLGGKSVFSLIDLRSGFHQINMHKDSIKYTSFVTPDGQWEYVKMPFGLKNAPAQFQRFINTIFHPLIKAGLVVTYLDDILIASTDFNSHVQTLAEVLKVLRKYGLELQLEKCKFAYNELDYLGYRANSAGIRPSDTHLESIKNYPMPKDKIQLQRCLGLFSYFRRFVESFSTIARPMTLLLRKDVTFEFNEACRQAFVDLKQKLLESPVLSIYDPQLETELHCDASSVGFGSVLLQKQSDRKFHPVAYFSKTTSPDESKLHSYELETLAIVYALKRFHTYLEGIPFKIVTDCNSLAQTLKNQSYSAKIARWALFLENYNYTIQHRAGSSMGHVDALSRIVGATYDESELDFQLQIMQCLDPEIVKLRVDLENGPVHDFTLKDDLVFRVSQSGILQLYVPKGLINNVIRCIHEKIGHLGIDKTYNQLRKNYWFPQMKNRIDNFIRNCLKCIVYSAPARRNQQNLHNIPKAVVPFDTIHIDHFGPLPSSPSRRKYILVITDAFTKFTKLYSSVSTSTREVCCALNQYFLNYSRPKRIISDRGSCFTSLEFTSYLEQMNIKHVLNATSSPQANGQVERVNRVLRPILSKSSNALDPTDWVKHLPAAEYALNNTVHTTTKFMPSVLLFGVQQRGEEVDELTEYLDDKNLSSIQSLKEVRQEAAGNITRAQETNLKYFLASHTPAPEFEEGECVVIRNVDNTSGTNKKLIPLYKGPYVIHKKLPNDRYVVRDIDGFQVTQMPYNGILEANKLRKWVAPSTSIVT